MNIIVFDTENVFSDLLQSEPVPGHSARAAGDIFTAKEYIIHCTADLVIIAVRQQDGNDDGMDLLRTMAASGITTPVIMLMAVTDVNLAVECVKLRAYNVIGLTGDQSADLPAIQKSVNEIGRKLQADGNNVTNLDRTSLLLIDDEIFSRSLSIHLESTHQVDIIKDFESAATTVAYGSYDFIFLDIRDEGNNNPRAGMELLKRIMAIQDDQRIIMLSGWADTATAVECLKHGAMDFIEKSSDIKETLGRIEGIMRKYAFTKSNGSDSPGSSRRQLTLIDIVGECGKMKKIRNDVLQIADHDVPVVIYGETGTGKEVVASAIHAAGSRRDNKFVVVNCGSIPESIFESEMFGYKKGSFTGALADRTGKMEKAHGGALFLDEIEALSLE